MATIAEDTTTAAARVASARGRRSLRVGLAALLVAAVATLPNTGGVIGTADAATTFTARPISSPSVTAAEAHFLDLLNRVRASNGRSAVAVNGSMASTSRSWSEHMSSHDALEHDPNLANVMNMVAPGWRRVAENVGVGYDVEAMHNAFWSSPSHRANMLGDFNQVGVGVAFDGHGRLWVTVRFALAPQQAAPAPAAEKRPDRVGIRRSNAQYLRRSLSGGPAGITFGYGTSADDILMGDWDGDGVATPGVFRDGVWHLRNSNTSGPADVSFGFGRHGDLPLVGDWDGNGTDTVGVWRSGHFFLRNHNSSGGAHAAFTYGKATDEPIMGDWDGNGTDTVGVRRGNAFHLRNANSGGGANIDLSYGWASDDPVAGDWDGNGTDTIGVRRGNAFHLRNSNSGGGADISFGYGWATDEVVIGQW